MKENDVSNQIESSEETIIIRPDENPAKTFLVVRQAVMKVAKKRGIVAIDQFIEDLQNRNNDNYEKQVQEINLGELSPNALKKLIDYIKDNVRKDYIQNEQRKQQKLEKEELESKWREKEAELNEMISSRKNDSELGIIEKIILDLDNEEFSDKEKDYILKKLNSRLNKVKKQEAEKQKQINEQREKAAKHMEQIQEVVNREYESGNIKNKANYLSVIRDSITGENTDIKLNIKIGKTAQKYLIEMIDENIKKEKDEMDYRIQAEKDELYFEQVRNFTNDFQFLRDDPLIVRARHGATKTAKFTDTESYERFCSLRNLLQKDYNENIGIENLLKRKNIGKADARILSARKDVINKEIEIKRKTGEIR